MKKIILQTLLLIVTSGYLFSQSLNECPKTNLIPVLINNKYGFCNKIGKIVIEPKFDDAEPFIRNKLYGDIYNENRKYGDNEYATVVINGEYFRIDTTGNIMCKFNPITIDEAVEGRDNEFLIYQKDNKLGIKIDSTVMIDCIYDRIYPFSYGINTPFMVKKDNMYGVVDINGNILIPIIYDDIFSKYSEYFSIGLIKVKLENKIFFIDYCGNKYIK